MLSKTRGTLYPAVGAFLVGFLCSFYKIDKELPTIQEEIAQRHREEAIARGEEYISPAELAEKEVAEQERVAEEKRVEELKSKCAKKGLNFDEEEAKYQTKLAADAAKKNKKK